MQNYEDNVTTCPVCFHHCRLQEGQIGFCGARVCRGGTVIPANYGKLTAMALDPIEKKPLARFHPGSRILSVGSYGCNLRCPFCQNSSISWSAEALALGEEENRKSYDGNRYNYDISRLRGITPEELAETAYFYRQKGNIGVAFTYNEPLIGWEFVRDTARLVHEKGMVNVLVSNGTAELPVLEQLIPHIDAMNIDLKGFTDRFYTDVLQGSREQVMDFIREAVQHCHVELTTLIIPGENDSAEEMEALTSWIAGLSPVYDGEDGRDIPLHISRFFPRFHMQDRGPTDVKRVYELAGIARRKLRYVYTGNC